MSLFLNRVRKFDEKLSKFYAAQVFMALDYLHALSLIYRDLKPENIMIDYKGFIKVTDFGFCKLIKERTYTLCGTPEYLAPEVIQNKGYGQSADWWSFGILIFEMSAGYSPFAIGHPDQMQLLERICAGKYRMSSSFGKELKALITNLLQMDLTRRFGHLRNGTADIKQHPWFNDIDWIALYNQDVKPPFVPKLTGPGDHSQFDDYEDVNLRIAAVCQYEREFADF
jgi:protein kinase A